MASIVEYVKEYGSYGFEEVPFSEVDGLVLSQFAYLNPEGHVGRLSEQKQNTALRRLAEAEIPELFQSVWYEKDNRRLFRAMCESRRFGGMELNYHACILNEDTQTQFAAMTVFLEKGPTIVLFRGTDTSIVGWKEDFNMAFRRPVTGHRLSTMYLNQVGYRISGRFFVSGHSKGGNFAVYGAMSCASDVRERIEAVYSFDGPGFRPELLDSRDFEMIRERIRKYMPRSSIVGMLLQTREEFKLVECGSVGILQHNPFTWKVHKGCLKEAEDIPAAVKLMNHTLNDWIFSREDEELELFVESLYGVITATNAGTLTQLMKEPGRHFPEILGALRNLDEETKEKLKEVMGALWEIGAENLLRQVQNQ
ncbi:MAG: DUF2974 domain-containing protein [Lachnospiraceae bacterium]|nr:DUF2974 domain-containing protein [Lachnospiraceae bacterium]